MAVDLLRVFQRFEPGEAVGVGPDRVVDTRKIGVELAAAFVQEVRQQNRHLVVRERKFLWPAQLVPALERRCSLGLVRSEFVPAVTGCAALGADRAGEHIEEEKTARDLPAALVACAGSAPVVAGELGRVFADDLSDLADLRSRDASDVLGALGGVLAVVILESSLDRLEGLRHVGVQLGEERLPVDPAAHEVTLPLAAFEKQVGDRQAEECFSARPRRQPVVGFRAGVRQTRVDANDRGTLALGFHDALRMRVEIVACFEVRRNQENHLCVGKVGRRTVVTHPALVADAGIRATDIGVAVVAIGAPRLEHAVGVTVFAGAADVIHHFVVAVFFEGRADPSTDFGEGLIPADAFPLTAAAFADLLKRVHDPLLVIDLVDRRRALGAVATTAGWVFGVALDLGDLARLVVEVGQQAAGGFTVEARGRYQRVVALDFVGPCLRVEFGPVVPLVERRILLQISHFRALSTTTFQLGSDPNWNSRQWDRLASADEGGFGQEHSA